MTPMVFFKPAIFALLAANAVIYATTGRASEGIDALAWFALLVLFEVEARSPRWTRGTRTAAALDLLRFSAAVAIAVAAFAFVREGAWLDAINAWLWIGVVAVLELEVRMPSLVTQHRMLFAAASVALYGALVIIALTWLALGAWFNAYDAALWIAAFVLIEMDLLRQNRAPPPALESI